MNPPPDILIVEDSPTQALRLQLELEEQGWGAIVVGSASKALEQIEHAPPGLMIVDYCLPGMRGDELCRRVRMNINTRGIPVIMLTADENEETEVRGLDSGADDFFKKSADTDILVLRVRAMLGRPGRQERFFQQGRPLFKRAKLLAIDDSETYLSHLRGLLEEEDYAVDTLTDPRKALSRLKQGGYDLALIDLVMPELDGIALCQSVVSMCTGLDNPVAVLMLTGREGKDDLTRALEAGADDFVGKSSDQAVLRGRIRALLRRKFFQEENKRILEELKNKELEAVQARAEAEAATARAADERRRHAETVADELRQAKTELEDANRELVRSNDELRQFAFVASHDLQEPLRSIASYCDLLKADCEGRLNEECEDYIERIVNGARRMKALVTALLSYSRFQRAEQIPFNAVALDEVVEDALANLHSAIEDAGAVVTVDRMPVVLGDRVQLTQLIQNLVANAILYRGEQSPRIAITSRVDGAGRQIAVRDNGIGIAPEHHRQIFEIFKRLHPRKTYPGTGIGLAICKKIAQRHGGDLTVESQVGAGSEFKFWIPASSGEQPDERIRESSIAECASC